MRASLFPLLAALMTGSCSPAPGPSAPEPSAEYFVFGTLLEIQLPGADPDKAARVFTELQSEFQTMHQEWHAWEPGELVHLNKALERGESAEASADIAELILRSQELERRSGGLFNPAIGKLVGLWGFHTSEFPILGPPPDPDSIEALVTAQPSSLDIEITNGTIRSSNPAVQLDFGGIAKGYATDLACEIIRGAGLDSALIDAGGDTRVMGPRVDRPWRIAVRDPAGGVAGVIEISGDAGVFTSGNYERFRQDAERRYPHILDPRSGWPVTKVASATVIAHDGTTADAAATAIVVAGPGKWHGMARAMGVEAALVIDEAGKLHATRAMMNYFTPQEGREVRLVD